MLRNWESIAKCVHPDNRCIVTGDAKEGWDAVKYVYSMNFVGGSSNESICFAKNRVQGSVLIMKISLSIFEQQMMLCFANTLGEV